MEGKNPYATSGLDKRSGEQEKGEKTLVVLESNFEPKVVEHETDVLVIGGGVAGCFAALGAKEAGAHVMVAEKYNIYSSGDAGTGEDHFLGILGVEDWDNPEEFYKTYISGNKDNPIEDRNLIRKFADELPAITKRFERMGMPFRDVKSGKYYRIKAFGEGHPYTIQFDGSNFKRIIASSVTDHNIPILNRVMITSIFVKNNQVIGATGLDSSNGSLHVFRTKCIVLTTGEGCRLYSSTSGHPFDSWHSPYNTGDGIAMAFRAGCEMANIEFLALTMCATGYSTPGTHAFLGMGCNLVNAKGERFMSRYHPLAERAPRAFLTWGIHSEIAAGRGPCYIDARHLSKDDIDRLVETLVVDKGPFGDYLRQKQIDLSKDLMEVSVSEFHAQCGILINDELETSVKGLYAAGEGTGSNSVSRVATEGYRAGKNASNFSRNIEKIDIPIELLQSEKSRIYAPLKKRDGISSLQFERSIREIMSKYVGFSRSEASMNRALEMLNVLEPEIARFKASNFHELMRTLESQNIYIVGRLVTLAAMQRPETRWGGGLISPRADYPEPDPRWANLRVTLKRKNSDRDIDIRIVPATSDQMAEPQTVR
ncbi:MAG: FAD-binding protein [Nitrososphaerota archaeon]|nr:FAD-binding protein [Nitrososphaerota archaeon]